MNNWLIGWLTDWLTDWLSDWPSLTADCLDWLSGWSTNWLTKLIWWLTDLFDWQNCWFVVDKFNDLLNCLLIDWLTDSLTDWWLTVDWQTSRLIDWLSDLLYWLTGWLSCWHEWLTIAGYDCTNGVTDRPADCPTWWTNWLTDLDKITLLYLRISSGYLYLQKSILTKLLWTCDWWLADSLIDKMADLLLTDSMIDWIVY